jgi:hypothetical protein
VTIGPDLVQGALHATLDEAAVSYQKIFFLVQEVYDTFG